MFSAKWQTSRRQYGVVHERDVAVPVSAGFTIDCDILRPDSSGKFPAILCFFPFSKEAQLKATMPVAVCPRLVMCEGGDFNFYVRRGYAQVFANVRGTGRSGGLFDHLGDGTTQDVYDLVEWLAGQPWCDGQVATFGTSYFVHSLKKEIFAPLERQDGMTTSEMVWRIQNVMQPIKYTAWKHEARLKEGLETVLLLKDRLPTLVAADPHYLSSVNECRSMVLASEMFFRATLARKESRGWFIREDYPNRDDAGMLKWVILQKRGEEMAVSYEDVPMDTYRHQPEGYRK